MTSDETTTSFDDGTVRVDFGSREVSLDGRPVHLSASEYLVLSTLVSYQAQPVSIDQLRKVLWGNNQPVNYSLALRGYIRRLREELDLGRGAGDDSAIEALPNFGYQYHSRP
jgi:two-component system, OmpR family, KDP operon response regulator KdpE